MSAVRVLYSFPHRIGAGRICDTAWHQVSAVAAAGGELSVLTGAVARPLPARIEVRTTLARGRVRISYRAIGVLRALRLHDRLVARRLPALASRIDVVHVWPSAARETLKAARALGVPTVLERPNAHTRLAYQLVERESARIGVPLPPGSEHAYDALALAREEEEYALADHLLCPSDFVERSFLDAGFPPEKLVRHSYGFDPAVYHAGGREDRPDRPLTFLFAGHAAVRKGLHLALEAWQASPASRHGRFLVAGSFLPAYEQRLERLLAHPTVQVLGHRGDLPELMRRCDALVLPTLEEGSPLVVLEAMASGCVPVVSDVCAGICRDGQNALVHRAGDVAALTRHLTRLTEDRRLVARLRAEAVAGAPQLTWGEAGRRLVDVYREVSGLKRQPREPAPMRASAVGSA